MARAGLDRSVIVRAALGLLDQGGLEALTARALGDRLGVRPSALYYHLPDMRALLDELATTLMREMLDGAPQVDDWRELLTATADRIRSVLNRHRDGARVFAGSRLTDAGLLPTMEQPLAVLTHAGLPLDEAFWALQTVLHYTVGFVIEEQHRREDAPQDYRPEVRSARIDGEAAPLTAAASTAMAADAERQFAFGVGLLVAGVADRLPGAQPSPTSARASAPPASVA